MSNNSDMIKMLRLVEGQQFAGLPEQKPGDQVRGTERAKKKGDQHPFHNRLVGEEISLEDKLSKKYQDMKDLHGKDKDVAEEGSENKYSNLSNRGVNRGINRAADDFDRFMDLDQAESPHYKTQHQQDTKQRLKTKPMAGPKGQLPEAAGPVDYEKVLEAIAALYGDDMWDNDAMGDLAQDLEQAGPTDRELDFIIAKGKLPTRLKNIRFTNSDDVQFGHLDEKSGTHAKPNLPEGVAESMSMADAVKLLRQYGAGHFKTGSETLQFYKNGRPFSLDLIWNDDTTRSVSLSQLNSVTRGLKGQGIAEGRNEIATGTPDAIKAKIAELGLGPYRRESTGSGGEAIFVFNKNPDYYIYQGQDGAWVLVQTNAESDQQGVAEGNFKQTPGQRQYRAMHSQLQSLANSGQINTPDGKQKAEKTIDTIQQLVDTDPSCAGSTVPSKKIWLSEQSIAEGNMPQSVIKSKQKYADMTDQEFYAAHKNKSAEELQAMAWRHGYGRGSNHYVAKHKKGSTVTEGQEEIEYICSGCSGSGEGPHEGTTCRTCHGSGVEMGYADEPEHEHDQEELDEDQHGSPMERPMLNRIMMRHMDLIEKYGIDRVLDAVREVADGIHIGPDDEIGTSDVSAAMVNVMNQLKSSDHAVDEDIPAGDINASGSASTSSGPAPAVSAGGTAPTTPSSTAPAPAATTAPAPAGSTAPGQQQPMTPEEQAALDKIKSNAGLKAQYDRLIQQAH